MQPNTDVTVSYTSRQDLIYSYLYRPCSETTLAEVLYHVEDATKSFLAGQKNNTTNRAITGLDVGLQNLGFRAPYLSGGHRSLPSKYGWHERKTSRDIDVRKRQIDAFTPNYDPSVLIQIHLLNDG